VEVDDVMKMLPSGIFTLRDRVAQVLALVDSRVEVMESQRDEAIELASDAIPQVELYFRDKWKLDERLGKLMKEQDVQRKSGS
jgi:hypothetical protein